MKPEDLTLYKPPIEVPRIERPESKLPMETQVAQAREFITEYSEPVVEALNTTSAFVSNGVGRVTTQYDSINDKPALLQKSAFIGGSFASGWLLNSLLFPKSGRIRRILTPVTCAAITASICYPNQATQLLNDARYNVKKQACFIYRKFKGTPPESCTKQSEVKNEEN
ncbi:uncharacterized protein LOC100186871 [Ciona intestinalis]